MRRKYDIRNKRNFIIILLLSIAVIGVFSLFIYRFKRSSQIEYVIETGSVLQDNNKNIINIEEDATLKIRWNGVYYLLYQDKKINLGKKVIVYNTVTSSMKLYGRLYEIDGDGKIIEHEDETILSNTTDTKFYKLDDREYLLVDRQIVSDDRSIETNNYMLVELDKMGNAKLSNNKLNLKTINPTTLVTSAYTFDIANEILTYGKQKIDLKKIIGSTNAYEPIEEKTSSESGDGTGTGYAGGNGTTQNTNVVANQNNGVGTIINSNDTGNASDIGEIKDKTKMTSVIRVQEGLTQIDVDYVIYDPYNEYKSVYAEIIKENDIEVMHLSKNDTHVVFDNLTPNTEYTIKFIYTSIDADTLEVKPTTFDTVKLITRMPVYTISVYKISNVTNKMTYIVNLQDGYNIDKIEVTLQFKHRVVSLETGSSYIESALMRDFLEVPENGAKSITGTFDLSDYYIDNNELVTLKIVNVSGVNGVLDINSSSSFRIGGN